MVNICYIKCKIQDGIISYLFDLTPQKIILQLMLNHSIKAIPEINSKAKGLSQVFFYNVKNNLWSFCFLRHIYANGKKTEINHKFIFKQIVGATSKAEEA